MLKTVNETRDSDGLKAVRMYPDNKLKAQVRGLGENLSAFDVLKDAFSKAA